MNYTEHVEMIDFLMDKYDFYPYKAIVAQELKQQLKGVHFNIPNEDFEILCDYCYDWFQHSNNLPSEIAECVVKSLTSNKLTLEDYKKIPSKLGKVLDELISQLY